MQVRWSVSGPDENGEMRKEPLPGVTMTVGEDGIQLLTDQNGEAETSMLEGRYPISFSYAGEDAILSVEHAEMIISGGSTTLIELTAQRPDGRVRIRANREDMKNASFLLREPDTGEEYGPYLVAGAGTSDLLAPGEYEVSLEIPEDCSLESWQQGENREQGKPETLIVSAGELTDIELIVQKLETRSLPVMALRIDEQGQFIEEALTDEISLTLYDSKGNRLQELKAANGTVSLTAADGVYFARMDDDLAAEKGLQEQADFFRFSEEPGDGIVFRQDTARLILQSVDSEGLPLPGGVYRIVNAGGAEQTVVCDAAGRGVSGPLPAGQTVIGTVSSPDGYDDIQTITVTAEAGVADEVLLTHAALGEAAFLVRLQSLDSRANPLLTPLPDTEIRIAHSDDSSFESFVAVRPDQNGEVSLRLRAGDYLAKIADGLSPDMRAGDPVFFHLDNEMRETVQLTAYAPLGGILLHLTGMEQGENDGADLRFSVIAPDGSSTALQNSTEGYCATGLPAGEYLLTQEQTQDGFARIQPRAFTVKEGEATEITVSLLEIAVLSVSKIGLTFNRDMETFSVPLSGEYRIYTMSEGTLIPYPSQDAQLSVWANVEAGDESRPAEIRLPADQEGTTYYLRETAASAGFSADHETHAVVAHAGEALRPVFAVASDRGFFSMTARDAESGRSLAGGSYILYDGDGNEILSFTAGEKGYANETALPVGDYRLRQTAAPEGYALSDTAETEVRIASWLSGTDSESDVTVLCTRIPADAVLRADLSLWQSGEEDRQRIGVDAGAIPPGMRLLAPRLCITPRSEQKKRTDIRALTISGTGDDAGNLYRARVEYALRNGGWQPASAVYTETLDLPRTVNLESIPEDVEAVRVDYIRADNGEEAAEAGFTPGQAVLTVYAEGREETAVLFHAELSGVYVYRTIPEKAQAVSLSTSAEGSFAIAGSGDFGAESGGRDGSVSGVAFVDTDADGLLEARETGRYAGLTVRLLDASGENVDVTRTDSEGRYVFRNIPTGEYCLQFTAGDSLVYSAGALYSDYVISHVQDGREGRTGFFIIDADHTDYVRNAGCLYAAALQGTVLAVQKDGEEIGMSGVSVTLLRTDKADAAPKIAFTGDDGSFSFPGLYPGDYRIEASMPSGYLADTETGRLSLASFTLAQGETVVAEKICLIRAASVEGMIWFDEKGSGMLSDPVRPLAGIPVQLFALREDGVLLQETVTDETGSYQFAGILPGKVYLQVELEKEYAFTRFTDQSVIYGAAGQTGTSQPFELTPGESAQDVFIGVTRPGRMEVRVFSDERADGIRGPRDAGLAKVALQLIRMESGLDADTLSAVTDSEGVAVFDKISPGAYVISYEMPGLWRTTRKPDRASANAVVSEVERSSDRIGRSDPVVIAAGESRVFTIGAAITGSITGTVFRDANANGLKDADESGLPDIVAELLDENGTVLRQTLASADGTYRFEGLSAGRYAVRFHAPDGFGFSGSERTAQAGSAARSTDSVSETRVFSLTAGRTIEHADAALAQFARVSGIVWEDADANGEPGEEEPRCAGVSVDLMNATGRVVLSSSKTDKDGRYVFNRLLPGSYLLRVLLPDGYVFTDAKNGAFSIANLRGKYGYSSAFAVTDGQVSDDVNFGILTEGSAGGTIWQDDNYDGRMDSAEAGIRGVLVSLLDENGEQLSSVRTDRKGAFLFEKLKPGRYALEVNLPAGYVFTADGEDSLAARSDLPVETVQLGTLSMGEKRRNLNIGALMPASVSGTVWFDADDDGRMRVGEAGMSGVAVSLRMTGGKDTDRVMETSTDDRGGYRLEGIMPGTAVLTYRLPEGNAFARNAPGRARVSTVPMADATQADSAPLTIAAGAVIGDRDVGVVSVGKLEGCLRETENGEGQRGDTGVAGAYVRLLDFASGEILGEESTDASGAYAFSFVRKGQYRLRMELPDGRIFAGGEGAAFAKTDELQQETGELIIAMGESRANLDAYCIRAAALSGRVCLSGTEEGIPGAVIGLLSGGTVIRSAETDPSGRYSFDQLRPGLYRIRYTLPENALFALDTALEMQEEDASKAETGNLSFGAGQSVEAETVSAVWGASIRGKVWIDQNADGRMDAGEERLPGILVFLMNDKAKAVCYERTDENGQYSFTRLREGVYNLFFTLPDGMLFTDRISEKGASFISPTDGSEGLTEALTLSMGGTIDEVNVGAIRPGEIGDTVWLDENGNGLQDYREPLIPGVRLRLIRETETGEVLDTHEMQSDEYGYFLFRSLRPGRYRLHVIMGEGDALTESIGASLSEIDSDPRPETAVSDVILLQSGQTLRNVDVGFLRHGG